MHVARLRTEEGTVTAIVGEPGRLYTQYCVVEFPIRLRKMANGDMARYSTPLDYPLNKARKHFRRIGREHGISKGVIKFLRSAQ